MTTQARLRKLAVFGFLEITAYAVVVAALFHPTLFIKLLAVGAIALMVGRFIYLAMAIRRGKM